MYGINFYSRQIWITQQEYDKFLSFIKDGILRGFHLRITGIKGERGNDKG